jgi:glycosyltransferase involved in cell wall biosynthesis
MENTFFTIIIPTYNRAQFIGDCIRSVLKQQYAQCEIIVVDDHSTDDTADIVSRYISAHGAEKIRYYRNERSKGANGARNTGILHARYDWLLFLDSDDSWQKNKLDTYNALLQQLDDNYHLIYDNAYIKIANSPGNSRQYLALLPADNFIGGFSKIGIRRDKLMEAGLLDESLRSVQDLDIYLRIARNGDIYGIAQELTVINKNSNIRISDNLRYKMAGQDQLIEKHRQLFNANMLSYLYISNFNRSVRIRSVRDMCRYFLKVWIYTFKGGNGIYTYLKMKRAYIKRENN